MKHIEITRKQGDLNREVWRFIYLDDCHALVLTRYQEQDRATARHKFKDVECQLETVPAIPADVEVEAVREFATSLRVAKSLEEARQITEHTPAVGVGLLTTRMGRIKMGVKVG